MAKEYIEKEIAVRAIDVPTICHGIIVPLQEILCDLPAADVEPVRRGQWIKMSDANGVIWVCNECGEELPRVSHFNPQFDLFPRYKSIDKTPYCPHCGVRMDGDI